MIDEEHPGVPSEQEYNYYAYLLGWQLDDDSMNVGEDSITISNEPTSLRPF